MKAKGELSGRDLGTMTAEAFPGYEALYERFESEWRDIAIRFVNGEM